jgi:hypothetical protein
MNSECPCEISGFHGSEDAVQSCWWVLANCFWKLLVEDRHGNDDSIYTICDEIFLMRIQEI